MRRHSPVKACLFISTAIVVGLGTSAQAQEEAAGTFLGRLVVSAGAPKVAIEVPQSVTVIDAEEINEAQPATVGDVLAQAPGVSTVGSESRFGESINIRGIGQGASADEPRIINLIDGVKKYYESYRQGSLFTDPEFFKSVEILRGPGSSTLYGSGAVGGVIAFETKDASDFLEDEDDTFALSQELEYKSNGGGKESATFLAFSPDQRFDVLIGFIYDESDFLKDGSGNDIFGTRVAETNLLVKGTYSFGDSLEHSVEAGFIRYEGSADDQLLDVIDNVATFGTVDRTVTDTTAYALARGTIIVAASGNSGKRERYHPSASEGVISVGSVGPDGKPSQFSTTGDHVALSAPGEAIRTPHIEGYQLSTGTSFAAPFVAGAGALLVARARRGAQPIDGPKARDILTATARPFDTPTRGSGAGIINLPAALAAVDQLSAHASTLGKTPLH